MGLIVVYAFYILIFTDIAIWQLRLAHMRREFRRKRDMGWIT